MNSIDPAVLKLHAIELEKALIEQFEFGGFNDFSKCSEWFASQMNAGDELVYAAIEDVRKLTESYIEQNEATVKKIFDKLRELEHRISYLEVGRN